MLKNYIMQLRVLAFSKELALFICVKLRARATTMNILSGLYPLENGELLIDNKIRNNYRNIKRVLLHIEPVYD